MEKKIWKIFRNIWKERELEKKYIYRYLLFFKEINKNIFIDESTKIYIYNKIHKKVRNIYLSKKYLYEWRKYTICKKKSTNDLDLELSIIDPVNAISIIDLNNRRKYLFTQNEMNKLIETCLFNSHQYEPEPNPFNLKNPYTNTDMTIFQLRDIDKQLKNKIFVWELFKNSGYCKKNLLKRHYKYLQKRVIRNYVLSLDSDDIKYYLQDIIEFTEDNRKRICRKCIKDEKKIKSKCVLNVITEWVEFLKIKRNVIEIQETIDKFYTIFKPECNHFKKKIQKKKVKTIFLNSFKYLQLNKDSIFIFKGNDREIGVSLGYDNDKIIVDLYEKKLNNIITENINIKTI